MYRVSWIPLQVIKKNGEQLQLQFKQLQNIAHETRAIYPERIPDETVLCSRLRSI